MHKNLLSDFNENREYPQSTHNLSKKALIASPSKKNLGSKITAALAIAMVTLPVLSVGIANYYFDSQGINKQEIRARGTDPTGITETQLEQRNHMLTIVLISAGATALVVGTITALWTLRVTKRNYKKAQKLERHKKEQQRQLFQSFIQDINRSLDGSEILEATVEEAKKILGCDRVFVCSLDPNDYGKIIAEAVSPGWIRALDKTIEDPIWDPKYLEKHGNEGFYAFNDLEEAQLPSQYLEQLAQLGIKANLVVPISHEDKLFAVLAANHCAKTHEWQQGEKEFLTELAAKVGFSLDNIQILAEASRILKQAETEDRWTKSFNDLVMNLRQSLQEEDILNITVEQVRQVLTCDRVVVYSFNQNNYGMVIAESVAGGWMRSLGIVMEDSCFASNYIKQYRTGQVKATDNIHEAELTECYLEQLEKLGVKANLVTPIINKNELFGLLIAHQCSEPRSWQQHEIRWLTQVANQVGFALDNAKLCAEQQNLRKRLETEAQWAQLFNDTVSYIRQSLQEEDILRTTVEQVHQVLKCDRVIIYSLNQHNYGMVINESVASGWTRVLGKTITDPCFTNNYINKYIDGRVNTSIGYDKVSSSTRSDYRKVSLSVKVTNNIYEVEMTNCYLEQLEKLSVKAYLIAPILHENKLFGLLIAHQCSEPRSWQQHEIRWLTQISQQISFALDNAKLLKQSQIKSQTEVVALTTYEKSTTDIIPVKTAPIQIDRDMDKVREKLVETTEKIKQINKTSQQLLQIQNLINDKLKDNE